MYCDVMTMSFYFTKRFWYFIAICTVSTHIFFIFYLTLDITMKIKCEGNGHNKIL